MKVSSTSSSTTHSPPKKKTLSLFTQSVQPLLVLVLVLLLRVARQHLAAPLSLIRFHSLIFFYYYFCSSRHQNCLFFSVGR